MSVTLRSPLCASLLFLALATSGCSREASTYQYSQVIETVRCPYPDSFDVNGNCPKPTTQGARLRFAVSVERQSVIRNVVEFEPDNAGSFTEELKGCSVFDAKNWSCRSSFEARLGTSGNTVTTFVEMRDGWYRADIINSLGTAFSYASRSEQQ